MAQAKNATQHFFPKKDSYSSDKPGFRIMDYGSCRPELLYQLFQVVRELDAQ